MARVVIEKQVTVPAGGAGGFNAGPASGEVLRVGQVLEVTTAQAAMLTALGCTTRAVGGPAPVPGTLGPAAVTRDQLGTAYAASNASP